MLIRSASLLALVVVGTLSGCYHGSARDVSARELNRDPGWVLVPSVRMVRQSSTRDCGAAALAMVLGRWGTPSSSSAEILKLVPVDPQHGIAAGALRDLARQKGLRAFLIAGEVDDLKREIGLNRPVLVGLVQHYGDKALSHYEVVVGINARARRILVLDPARGQREDGFDGFTTEWNRSGRLAIVVAPQAVPPG